MPRHVTYGDDGRYRDARRGLCRGCPLSPLLGALYLQPLDERLEGLVLAPTRWKLRKAIKLVNRSLAGLKLEKHPAKTFIGRIEAGFHRSVVPY